MKYYFASLEPAWSKINYHNGIMWEASQHIQLQPSLGNKTNTDRLPLSALLSIRRWRWEVRVRWYKATTETLWPGHLYIIIYHSAVSITSLQIFLWLTFHVQYKQEGWNWSFTEVKWPQSASSGLWSSTGRHG